jgi:choline dehydrogenase-like flavoprotein
MIPGYLPSTLETGKSGKRYVSFLIGLQHMVGRGTVHISSPDPFVLPTVNPNVLKEEVDMEVLVDSIKFIRRLVQTPPYKNVVIEEVLPGSQVKTDEDIRDYIRVSANTIHHPASTASMLPRKDGGVVDPDLKVYGTTNLRIVCDWF